MNSTVIGVPVTATPRPVSCLELQHLESRLPNGRRPLADARGTTAGRYPEASVNCACSEAMRRSHFSGCAAFFA